MLRFTGEKMSKSVGNIATIREVLDEYGRETLLVFFLGGALAQADRLLGRHDGAGAPRRPRGSATSSAAPSEPGGDWDAFAAALDDDFNTPEALALMHELARPRRCSGAALAIFGLDSLAEREQAPPEVVELAERRVAARGPSATSRPPTRCAPRSRRQAGRCATRPAATRSSAKR